jgi:hypothetical protein
MKSSKEYTIQFVEKQLMEMKEFGGVTITQETVGRFLCGENHILAKYPFSEEFLSNVAFNGIKSMPAILWCQLTALN